MKNNKVRFLFLPALALFLFASNIQNGQAQRIYSTNTAYEEGDWISYMQSRYVHSLQVAPELVYVATEGGILRYDFYQKKWLFPFTVSNGLAENYILAVAYNVATRLLWCTTPQAICVYDPGAKIWQNYYLDEIGMSPADPVLSIGFSDSRVWFETRSGGYYFTPLQEFSFSPFLDDPPDSGIVWFGQRGFSPLQLDQYSLPNSLMFIDNGRSYAIQDDELRDFRFSYYVVDPWQVLWVGTAGMGLLSADTRLQYMVPLPFGLLTPDVRAICKNGAEMWLGGIQPREERRGVTRWNRRTGKWEYYEGRFIPRFRSDDVYAIESYAGSVWFATADGMMRWDPAVDRWFSYTVFDGLSDNLIYTLAAADSALWVGTRDGLDRIVLFSSKKDSLKIEHITPVKDRVAIYDLLLDQDRIWAATNYGLYIYHPGKKKGGYYRGADGPGAETVVALDRSGDSLWVATLHRMEVYDLRNEVWRGGPARKVFAGDLLLDVAASRKAIFVGTDTGLYRYDLSRRYWKQYTRADGLLNERVQKLYLEGDYLWIGSPEGLTRFYWNSPYRID